MSRRIQGKQVVSLDKLADAIDATLDEYKKAVDEQFKKDLRATAKVVVEEIKKEPAGAGRYHDWDEYSAGWRYKTEHEHFDEYRHVVYNKDKPGLTHLLEEGHINQDGTFARAFPHIAPAAEKGAEEMARRFKKSGT